MAGLARVLQFCSEQHQTAPYSDRNGFGACGRVELSEDRGDVKLDSMFGDRKLCRDFFIAKAAREHLQHLAFTRRERLREVSELMRFRRLGWKNGTNLPGMKNDQPQSGSFDRGDELVRRDIRRQNGAHESAERVRKPARRKLIGQHDDGDFFR